MTEQRNKLNNEAIESVTKCEKKFYERISQTGEK